MQYFHIHTADNIKKSYLNNLHYLVVFSSIFKMTSTFQDAFENFIKTKLSARLSTVLCEITKKNTFCAFRDIHRTFL